MQQPQQLSQIAKTAYDWWPVIIGAISAIFAALGAAFLTLWWQRRNDSRDAKLGVFSTLMMHRKANPPNVEWVNALNLIDLVFADNKSVLTKWHQLYEILNNPMQFGTQIHQHTYLEMLSEMAVVLGFKNLQQTDIDKFYSPQAYAVQAAAQQDLYNLVKGFFENVNRVMISQQQPLNAPPSNPPNPSETPKTGT